jgi:hypothetical protein
MRIYFSIFFSVLFIAVVSSCSNGIQSHSLTTKGVDLKKYKSYAWAKPDEEDAARKDDKIYASLILELCNNEMNRKGYTLNTEQPDIIMLFDTRVEDRVSYSQTPQTSVGIGFGGPGYYGSMYAPVAGGDYVPHNYQQGMLFIEMYETQTQKLLWRGWAEDKITRKSDIESDIRTAVRHIFMRLPVKHK